MHGLVAHSCIYEYTIGCRKIIYHREAKTNNYWIMYRCRYGHILCYFFAIYSEGARVRRVTQEYL